MWLIICIFKASNIKLLSLKTYAFEMSNLENFQIWSYAVLSASVSDNPIFKALMCNLSGF